MVDKRGASQNASFSFCQRCCSMGVIISTQSRAGLESSAFAYSGLLENSDGLDQGSQYSVLRTSFRRAIRAGDGFQGSQIPGPSCKMDGRSWGKAAISESGLRSGGKPPASQERKLNPGICQVAIPKPPTFGRH